jgi:hypothetical protein
VPMPVVRVRQVRVVMDERERQVHHDHCGVAAGAERDEGNE